MIITSIQEKLREVGFEDSNELVLLAKDFVDRPEVFSSSVLQNDFGFDVLMAHRTRAAVMNILSLSNQDSPSKVDDKEKDGGNGRIDIADVAQGDGANDDHDGDVDEKKPTGSLFKSAVVNEKARSRRQTSKAVKAHNYDYGLPSDYRKIYPVLAKEMDDFFRFMTVPSTVSQEATIRPATADVYMRHARLFLGWYITRAGIVNGESTTASIYSIVPSKEKESAESFLEYILWLRSERQISVSYEANILRGLTKFLKFRFAKESESDPAYGEKSFDDIPLIRELRKLHRDANRRQSLSPRSSDEERKWLSWSEYLGVIQKLKDELQGLVGQYDEDFVVPPTTKGAKERQLAAKRRIATIFQHYLILSFFACVPDRQRTIRELELDRTFIKDEKNGVWVMKHGPDDYKTGKTYGDRPMLVLTPELVPAIDEFLSLWRPCLNPTSQSVFVQPRTGKPLTQDSVYQIVSRACYRFTGKRTNPHLLRDMIVTHVRESDASEKELEALALYMGHSIHMQRSSYDRRTLTTKVAPAVNLLKNVNQLENNGKSGD